MKTSNLAVSFAKLPDVVEKYLHVISCQ